MNGVRCTKLLVHSDSELMVRQVNGQYKVRDSEIRKYHRKVTALIAGSVSPIEVKHIPREKNADADILANLAIDERSILMPEPFPPLSA